MSNSPAPLAGHWKRDAVAALNVALLGLPQSIAYAMVAGLPLHVGVLSTAFASMIAPFFMHSPLVVPGASNATAFLIFSALASPNFAPIRLMPVVMLITGVMLITAAILKLSDLVRFISRSVLVGYLTGAGLLIIVNQLRPLAGIPRASRHDESTPNFFTLATEAWNGLAKANPRELFLGLGTMSFYLILKALRPKWPVFIITFALTTLAAYLLHRADLPVRTIDVKASAFSLSAFLPQIPASEWLWGLKQIPQILGLCAGMSLLCLIETSVMSRNLASRRGLIPQVGKDIRGVGIANIFCGVLAPMPVSGSMTRSVLNEACGAVTRWSTFLSGVFTIAIAFAFADSLHWIPSAGLAALVIMIAVSLIKPKEIRVCYKTTKQDAATLIGAFVAALLLPLHIAVFVGVGISIVLFLKASSHPDIVEYDFSEEGSLRAMSGQRLNPAIAIMHVEGSLFFGAADIFRSQLAAFGKDPQLKILILRLKNAHHLDATGILALEELVRELRADGRAVLISGVMKDIYKVMLRSGIVGVIGRENIFRGSTANPNLATRHALRRAQEILGSEQADVRIFVTTKDKKPA